MGLENLTSEVYADLVELMKKYKGEKRMKIRLIDKLNDQELLMSSPTSKIEINRNLIKDLKRIPGLEFSLK
jgi:hypothetical protein